VPLVVADIHLQAGVTTTQQLNASYNAFIYVIEGSVGVGDNSQILTERQVGWLNKVADVKSADEQSSLTLTGGSSGARIILYAAQPQNDPIVSYGPFIADEQSEIRDLYSDFRHGKIRHVSELPAAQRFSY
jgi:redox-sensitive bicupin YhaK (pirin superfamily)